MNSVLTLKVFDLDASVVNFLCFFVLVWLSCLKWGVHRFQGWTTSQNVKKYFLHIDLTFCLSQRPNLILTPCPSVQLQQNHRVFLTERFTHGNEASHLFKRFLSARSCRAQRGRLADLQERAGRLRGLACAGAVGCLWRNRPDCCC